MDYILDALLIHDINNMTSTPSFNFITHTWPYPLEDAYSKSWHLKDPLNARLFSPSEFIPVLMAPQCPTTCSLNLAAAAPLSNDAAHED